MTIWFDRPIGAHADVNELEYIAALHQTCMPHLRTDGSIHAEDIVNYLVSRHGIRTTVDVVNDQILNNLAGNLDSQQPPILDMTEVISILLIPHLKRALDENQTEFFERLHMLFRASVPLDGDSDLEENEQGQLLLTPLLIQTFLEEHGEYDVPPQIVEEMIAHVSPGDSSIDQQEQDREDENIRNRETAKDAVPFTVEILIRALTSDLGLYDPSREALFSTHVQDVFDSVTRREETHEISDDEDTRKKINDEKALVFKRVFTLSTIDHGADTFTSPTWVILVWVLLVILYLSFVSGITSANYATLDCKTHLKPFGCNVVNGIITWCIIFLQLTILGVTFVTLTSLGNSVYDEGNRITSVAKTLVAIVTIFATTIASLFVQLKTPFFDTTKRGGYEAAYYGAAGFGFILIYVQILELIRVLLGRKFLERHPRLQRFMTSGTIRKESRIKSAAAFKVNKMVLNALEVHDASTFIGSKRASSASTRNNAMLQYQMLEHRKEPAGGVLWGWKRVWDGTIAREEGVWLHARLLACNMAQVFVTIFILVFWTLLLRFVRYEYDQLHGFKIPVTVAEIDAALTLGAFGALGACLAITVVFIPSFISTCIQFRSGVIPSLRSKSFEIYRFAEDNTSVLFGSCFWGVWSTGFVCWALVGLSSFFVVWHVTRELVLILVSNVLGLIITLIFKMVILLILRQTLYRGFYRKHPAFANLVSLAMECWNLGLSTGYMLARTIQLLMVTAFYIGRLDTPVLAPGVGVIGPLTLDAYPIIFRKDLLLHDAHRHPFIERLGMMYMMKLLHGDAFANRAGSCWRVLLVLVLMPWLRKYRIPSTDQANQLQAIQQINGNESAYDDEELQHENEKFEKRQNALMQQDVDGVDRESFLEREVVSLRKRSHLQQKEIEQLRELLKKATESVETDTPGEAVTS